MTFYNQINIKKFNIKINSIINRYKNLWKKIFDDCCLNGIINIIKLMMEKNDALNEIKESLINPLLSVVCGAARYGYKTDFIPIVHE